MKALGWLAIGGVGLVVLDYLGYVDVSSWFKTTTVPSDGTSTTPQANNPNAAVQNTTLGLIAKSVADHGQDPAGYMSVSQWNVYYKIVRGIDGPTPTDLFPGNPNANTQLFSLNEYWGAMTGNGFSGLGLIAHYVNPYTQGPRAASQVPFGAGLAPTGMETYVKRVN